MTPMLLHVRCFITAACAEEPKLDKLLVFSITSHFVLAEALVIRSDAEFAVMLRSYTAHQNCITESIQPSRSLRNCAHFMLTHIAHVESFFTSFTKLAPGESISHPRADSARASAPETGLRRPPPAGLLGMTFCQTI